ncbi:hypothetical protein ND748_19355 [Frankia sp. AiPs1]|uniref:hypothetical protein n=1 Tax=Frankia sp. AiPs1 TaxID=573493 RepID=UPI002042C9E1|nr:hypothetical protein [Frankia sp. AiPs1]MCM3923817.1 hypothetical protein [Frankia sp. AiPs1]
MGDGVPVAPVVRWGLATFGSGRRLEGLIGPFDSPAAAESHARERCYGDWTVAPMLCVTDAEEVAVL